MSFTSCFFPLNMLGLSCRFNILQVNDMIHTKDHTTGYLFDPWRHLGPKRRRLLQESWAGLFREHILCELPVNELAVAFCSGFGRPTKELYSVLGVLILQQMKDLSDEETMVQLAFNEQWHFALDITDTSDGATYMSPKTLWNMRKIVTDKGLESVLFEKIADVLAEVFEVDPSRQRIDSVHIRSNMRRLGRVRIFAETIHSFLINLRRQHKILYGKLSQELKDKYVSRRSLQCFSLVKPSESTKTLNELAADLYELLQTFSLVRAVTSMHSYRLMGRVLKDHCTVTEPVDDSPPEVVLKEAKEVSSDSLQNPSDPDATYDGHKGQGYQVQFEETYCDSDDKEVRERTLNLITYIEVQRACESDANALMPAIESTKERGLAPKDLLADSLYGGEDNCRAAKKEGTEVISPVMGLPGEKGALLSEFTFSDTGSVIACPQGHKPLKTKHKGTRHTASFSALHCESCSLTARCPVKKGKQRYYLRYEDKARRVAQRRTIELTDEFKDRYRWRAGIEASMSEYDRRTGVKRLRVRGMKAVRYCAVLKAIGLNLYRATAVRKARMAFNDPFGSLAGTVFQLLNGVKELFCKCRLRIRIHNVNINICRLHYRMQTA